MNERARKTGRYTYTGNFDRLCVCGHKLGEHTAEAPHECIVADFRRVQPCFCTEFRPERKKK